MRRDYKAESRQHPTAGAGSKNRRTEPGIKGNLAVENPALSEDSPLIGQEVQFRSPQPHGKRRSHIDDIAVKHLSAQHLPGQSGEKAAIGFVDAVGGVEEAVGEDKSEEDCHPNASTPKRLRSLRGTAAVHFSLLLMVQFNPIW
ncbi:MAG: hypothetical protein DYG98_02070 [Haliscomenobacteraceae bacterium CHB4]|nr:hypothetical protein [Haliscomenobacteraceae bacterium CHB4]